MGSARGVELYINDYLVKYPIYAIIIEEVDIVPRSQRLGIIGIVWLNVLNWAHRSVDKHTTHKIDHTIYSTIEEWNNAKMACSCECFH